MEYLVVHTDAIKDAEYKLGLLGSRMAEFQRTAAKASELVSGRHPWGLLGEIRLRGSCMSVMDEFQDHLRYAENAVHGARLRLRQTASNYSEAEQKNVAAVLSAAFDEKDTQGRVRQLNWASRFYQDHHIVNGALVSLPYPFGYASASVLGTGRFISDLTSDDHYNLGADFVGLADDFVSMGLTAYAFYKQVKFDPLGYLVSGGVAFLCSALWWTKYAADCVTGDPLATGQAAYQFDSIAEALRRLAGDLQSALNETIGDNSWQGTAAELASKELTGLRDALAETGSIADGVAAMLQLASSLIGSVENIVISAINSLINWAVMTWFAAHLTAAETGGVSEFVAAGKIYSESSRTASRVGKFIDLVTRTFRHIATLFERMLAKLREIKLKGFSKLAKSPWGQKSLRFNLGTSVYTDAVKRDIGSMRYSTLSLRGRLVSLVKQAGREGIRQPLRDSGFNRYNRLKSGAPTPGGKWVISPIRIPYNEHGTAFYNWPAVLFRTSFTVLPFGRSLQYWSRSKQSTPPPSDGSETPKPAPGPTPSMTDPSPRTQPTPSPIPGS
jgi:hypothetical protein